MSRIEEIVLEAEKGQPTVEILFGQAHIGNYRLFLWDEAGQHARELALGTNADEVVDTVQMDAAPATLNGRILSFEGLVQAAEARADNLYSLTVTVRQDGVVCPGGVIQDTGSFVDVKALLAFKRFRTR